MDPSKRAISYIRWSSDKQTGNDSLRRQMEGTADFCKRHGLWLDESYSYKDEGVSAFRGTNATTGDLRQFLDQVQSGKIPRGSCLVIEKLDRLDRRDPMSQLIQIDHLLRAGIRIATFASDRIYSQEDLERSPYVLYEILSHCLSGHEESAKKSWRCREAWNNKRKLAASGVPMGRTCAAWLKLREDRKGFDERPYRVAVVRRIYALSEDGVGAPTIAKTLNDEGVPSFGGKTWASMYVVRLLRDRRVLGELESHRWEGGQKTPLGVIAGYYPAILSQEQFDRVQVGMSKRFTQRGQTGKWRVNLFKGLLFDARTGSTLGINTYNYSPRDDGIKRKNRCRLVARRKADGGGGVSGSFLYDPFEAAFFRFVRELDPADFAGTSSEERVKLASLSARLTLLAEKITDLDAEFKDASDRSAAKALLKLKLELEGDRERVKEDYERLRMSLSSPAVEAAADARTLAGMLASSPDPDALRRKIRARLKQLIESIWVLVYDAEGSRHAAVQVCFRDGTFRSYSCGYSLSPAPYCGIQETTDRVDSVPIDLRTWKQVVGTRDAVPVWRGGPYGWAWIHHLQFLDPDFRH